MEECVGNIDKITKKENFGLICRCCLMQGPMASIFELKYEDILFCEILNKLFSIELNSDDELPQNVCETCIGEIIRFYNFKKTFENSKEILQSIVNSERNKLVHSPISCKEEIKLENFVNTTISNDPVETKSTDNLKKCEILDDDNEYLENKQIIIESSDESEIQLNYENEDIFTEENIIIENPDLSLELDEEESKNEDYILENNGHELQIRKLSSGVKKKITPSKTFAPKIFRCSCQKTFALQSEYLKHRKEEQHPRPRNHSCKICQKTFTLSGLKQHMRRHTKEKPYECKICTARFSLSGNLRRHMMRHTGERPHVCEFCGKGFIQAPSLTVHKRIHTGERPYLCMYCGKRYGSNLVYKLHLHKHGEGKDTNGEKIRGEGGYRCKFCHKVFNQKPVLYTHMLIHGEKKFLCSECGKSFYSNAALQSHSKVHTGAKPYSCSVCYRTFAQSGSLKTHMYMHTGKKPYTCKICSKAFTQSAHLKTHLRTHSGERPYTCSYCNKTFPHSGTLTVHVRTHTGETPYMCDRCPRGFYDSSSLKRHKKRHSEDNSDIKNENV